MAQTLNLLEHELRSIRGWLSGMYPGSIIHITRPTVEFSRPAFMISSTSPRQFVGRGTGFGVEATGSWQIETLVARDENNPVNGKWLADRDVADISDRLLTTRVIPLYLYSWQYPAVTLEVLSGAGSLTAGELSVIVTAISHHEDEESFGEAVTTTVANGDAVRIWITPWPRQSTVAKEFRVYAGASGSELQEASVVPADLSSPLAVSHDLTALAGGGDPYSDLSSSRFFYRHMRVDPDSVTTEVLEHPEADGLFNGYVRFSTEVLSQRVLPSSRPVEEILVSDLEVV